MVIIPRGIASTSLTNPVYLGDERLTLAALLVGVVCAIGALSVNRAVPSFGLRWLCVAVAAFGGIAGGYLMWGLIGNCGLQVIWDVCRP